MRNSTQLPAAEASKGFQILLDVIKEFRSGHNALFLGGKYRVSAEVQGKPMVDDETISCILTPHHDSVDVSVYWEDMGEGRRTTSWASTER